MGHTSTSGVVIVCDGTDAAAARHRTRAVERPRHRRDAPCRMLLRPGHLHARRDCRPIHAEWPALLMIDPQARCPVSASASAATGCRAAAAGDAPVYGVNTGFGKLASTRIGAADLRRCSWNLIRSHCSVGVRRAAAAPEVVRLALALKAASLALRAHRRARRRTIDALAGGVADAGLNCLRAQRQPGGASGDLRPPWRT